MAPTAFVANRGGSMDGSVLKVKPAWAAKVEVAQTIYAALIRFPKGSISFIIASWGMALTAPTKSPTMLKEFTPNRAPSQAKGRLRIL